MPHDSTYRDFTHRHRSIHRVRYPWCIPRAAPHVHDGRRHYAHRIPWYRARILCNGRLKLTFASSRGNISRRRNGMAYRDGS